MRVRFPRGSVPRVALWVIWPFNRSVYSCFQAENSTDIVKQMCIRDREEEPHPRFVEAIQKKTYVEYLLDLFLYESEEEQKALIAEHTAEITHLERRLKIMAERSEERRVGKEC